MIAATPTGLAAYAAAPTVAATGETFLGLMDQQSPAGPTFAGGKEFAVDHPSELQECQEFAPSFEYPANTLFEPCVKTESVIPRARGPPARLS